MKTWRFVVEFDSNPLMGWPEDTPDQKVLELIEQVLMDGGLDNDLTARVRLVPGAVEVLLRALSGGSWESVESGD